MGLSAEAFIEPLLLMALILVASPACGRWMARVFEKGVWGEPLFLKIFGLSSVSAMSVRGYLMALGLFNLVGFLVLLLMLVGQQLLPLNPENLEGLPLSYAVNIAVSFVTNTNWQIYSGEEVLSPFVQMAGLSVQNFLSAGTSLCLMVLVARAIRSKSTLEIGNFWVDLLRSVVGILLPLSIVFAVVFSQQGMVQSFSEPKTVPTLEQQTQKIVVGPVASQVSIKMLGANGGGYFGANSAHPFENPTPLTNFLSLFAILLLPAGCIFAFGRLSDQMRHARALFFCAFLLVTVSVVSIFWSQMRTNSAILDLSFGEGIETRFGLVSSSLWAALTTATSNGSANAALSSMSPLAGFFMLFNLVTGGAAFGGVGSGVVTLVFYSLLTVFIAGLMVGRTPEYLGKKLSASEVVYSCVSVLVPSLVILIFTSLACVLPGAVTAISQPGPHGLSELFYAFASTTGNNGSSFGGINSTNSWILWLTTIAMLAGRICMIVPSVMIAGLFAQQKNTPPSDGTFPTHGLVFGFLLLGLILVVGVLTFFPALILGPFVEDLLMNGGRLF